MSLSHYEQAKRIVGHEFSDEVIREVEPILDKIRLDIEAGLTTFEEVEKELLEQWKKLNEK